MSASLLRRILPVRRPARRSYSRPRLEQLESRLVPSLTRLPDVLVNPGNPATGTDPNADDETSYQPPQVAVAEDASGNFVVVWNSTVGGNFENGINVLAQRFNPVGQPLGGVITVASGVPPESQNPIPAVGMDSAGDFVVAFDSSSGIFARRYNASGTSPDATPFQVDTGSMFDDFGPSVALDDQGQFIVTWVGADSSGFGVYGRAGTLTGSNPVAPGTFTLASDSFYTGIFYQSAAVATDAAGDFVAAYAPVSGLVVAQRLDAAGDLLGSPITLSASGAAVAPSVAVARDSGTFAVTWVEEATVSTMMAETFTVNGTPLAGPFAVSPAADPPSTQPYDTPAVAADASGNFVAVWSVHGVSDESSPESGVTPDGQGNDPEPTGNVYAQAFASGGKLSGGVLTIGAGQNAPGPTAVAMDPAGEYVVTYIAAQQTQPTMSGPTATGNTYNVIAVIFHDFPPAPPLPTPPAVVTPAAAPVTNTADPTAATAYMQGEQKSENEDEPVVVVPPEPELPVVVNPIRQTPQVPVRDRLALALIQEVGGTAAVGAISGKLFADLNGDGLFEEGKPPLAGRTVFLDLNNNGILDEGEPVAVTNENGEYSFSGLSLRTYQVRQLLVSGDVQTMPAENNPYEVRLDGSRHDVGGKDFGNLYTPRRNAPGRVVPVPLPAPAGGSPPGPSGFFEDDDGGDPPADD